MTALLNNGSTPESVELPSYFVDFTSNYEDFVEIKKHLREVFDEYFHSETFKSTTNTEGVKCLNFYLNEMLDGLFVAQEQGKTNRIKEQFEKIQAMEKVEPLKEILN